MIASVYDVKYMYWVQINSNVNKCQNVGFDPEAEVEASISWPRLRGIVLGLNILATASAFNLGPSSVDDKSLDFEAESKPNFQPWGRGQKVEAIVKANATRLMPKF